MDKGHILVRRIGRVKMRQKCARQFGETVDSKSIQPRDGRWGLDGANFAMQSSFVNSADEFRQQCTQSSLRISLDLQRRGGREEMFPAESRLLPSGSAGGASLPGPCRSNDANLLEVRCVRQDRPPRLGSDRR